MKTLATLTMFGALLYAPVFAQQAKAETIEWEHLNSARGDANPRAGKLWGDRTSTGAFGFLIKFEKGFSSPLHIHNVTYRGVVIKGLVKIAA